MEPEKVSSPYRQKFRKFALSAVEAGKVGAPGKDAITRIYITDLYCAQGRAGPSG